MYEEIITYFFLLWILLTALAYFLHKKGKKVEVGFFIFIWRIKEASAFKVPEKIKNKLSKGATDLIPVGVGASIFSCYFISMNIVNFFVSRKEIPVAVPFLGVTLPVFHGLLAIITALVIHELMHGLLCSVEGVKMKSIGFILFFFFPAAFVEIDPESFEKADPVKKLKVLSAGSAGNIALALITLLIGFILFTGYLSNPAGVIIVSTTKGTPASAAGIKPYCVIKEINGTKINTIYDFFNYMNNTKPNQKINISTDKGNYVLVLVAHPKKPSKGFIGVMVDTFPYFNPRIPLPTHLSLEINKLIFWVFNINLVGTLNMMPAPFLDGEKFFNELYNLLSVKLKSESGKEKLKIAFSVWGAFNKVILAFILAFAVANFVKFLI